ncbi:hypothetical protein GCM10022226_62530 [Sphaerisporangium flaviroseum]|uniref:Uncharacterized protein n=1 Tax=Sphaerisporangium flaviroseum TaxID=509199 RepID=A0ABP7J382_9ACTN
MRAQGQVPPRLSGGTTSTSSALTLEHIDDPSPPSFEPNVNDLGALDPFFPSE